MPLHSESAPGYGNYDHEAELHACRIPERSAYFGRVAAAAALSAFAGCVRSSSRDMGNGVPAQPLCRSLAKAPVVCVWRGLSLGLMLAGVIGWLLEQGDILTPLLLLALVHNMTPLSMAWDLARDDVSARPLAWLVSGLFVLPAAIIVWGEGMQAWATAAFVDYAPLLDSQLPTQWGGMRRQAILSAIVLSQCLHYYCVIRLLPNAESQRIGRKVLSPTVKIGTLLASMLLIGYYVIDYSAARMLYAVAAGAHAWLEWPVLLMALLACTDKQPLSTFKHRSVDET